VRIEEEKRVPAALCTGLEATKRCQTNPLRHGGRRKETSCKPTNEAAPCLQRRTQMPRSAVWDRASNPESALPNEPIAASSRRKEQGCNLAERSHSESGPKRANVPWWRLAHTTLRNPRREKNPLRMPELGHTKAKRTHHSPAPDPIRALACG
jgi:hypothetical protein